MACFTDTILPTCIFQGLLLVCLLLSEVRAETSGGSEVASCLRCHAETAGVLTFRDGTNRPLRVPESLWRSSIHGAALLCTECHQNVQGAAHARPRRSRGADFASDRDYVVGQSESCQRCHYAYYSRAMDSIHAKLRASGNKATPTCGDCHPAHRMTDPRSPQAISAKCGTCHLQVYEAYRSSVHGKALVDTGNKDVPVCIDCHSAHSIVDPRTSQFHALTPELCAKCHSNEETMKRNGLDTAAFKTYLDDFHGKSNQLYNHASAPAPKIVASCTDCHGVHDVHSFRGAGQGIAQVRERLIATCRKCHGNVPVEFARAWLSHYPVRRDTAPVLWTMKKFYAAFNPFMAGIFGLTVLLNLWRVGARVWGGSNNGKR